MLSLDCPQRMIDESRNGERCGEAQKRPTCSSVVYGVVNPCEQTCRRPGKSDGVAGGWSVIVSQGSNNSEEQ